MAVNLPAYTRILGELTARNASLVAVSKTKPGEDVLSLYEAGQRDFGENYVQEMVDKAATLPDDIRWHFIGHLQTNKVKMIAPFVQLIHGVDSLRLLQEINKQGEKFNRIIDCLLQVHIAQEETKFGLDENELEELLTAIQKDPLPFARVKGLMGMASFTENDTQIREEFKKLRKMYDKHPSFTMLSMGMSSDYRIALEEGSNVVRIGSILFGERSALN
jgi:PLP dependent protein